MSHLDAAKLAQYDDLLETCEALRAKAKTKHAKRVPKRKARTL